jgi:arginase family enzyme
VRVDSSIAGDVVFDPSRGAWETIEDRAGETVASGAAIFLGGDHAITHPIVRAVYRRHSKVCIVHIDAHTDIYDGYQGNRRSHTSPAPALANRPFARSFGSGLRIARYRRTRSRLRARVAHREPGGLSTRQVIEIIQAIDRPIVAADIVEYNPRCDVAGMTATVAAKLLKELAGMMIVNSKVETLMGR